MARREPRLSLEAAFARVVRERRTQLGLSQEGLGFEADLHRTYVSMLERGERVPSLTTVGKLAKALGVKPSKLLAAAEELVP